MDNSLRLSSEDIAFLKELSSELNTQEHDYQATPRFWVVGDYEWVATSEGNEERRSVYIPSDGESYTLDEYVTSLKNGLDAVFMTDELKSLIEEYEQGTGFLHSIEQYILDNLHEDAQFFSERQEHIIKRDTLFLTKQACKDHISENYYHYTNRVHSYAMTAWRSPKVERLIKILEKMTRGDQDGNNGNENDK